MTATLDDPFAGLTAAFGDLGPVTVDAADVPRQGLRLDVEAHLRDVTTGGRTGGGTADVTVPYPQLADRLGAVDGAAVTVGADDGADDGGLALDTTVGAMGLPVTVHARVSTAADRLVVTPTEVTVLDRTLPVGELTGLPGQSGLGGELRPRTVTLDALPAGVALTSAEATDAGLVLHFALSPSVAAVAVA